MGLRDYLSSTDRTEPRAIAAVLAQKGTSRVDGLLANGGLAISGTATDFKTTRQAIFSINGTVYEKAATDLLPFSAADVVSAGKYGAFLVQIDNAGAISTKAVGTPQAYATAADALAAVPDPDAGHQALGTIVVLAGGVDWTANASALTGVATFHDADEVWAA